MLIVIVPTKEVKWQISKRGMLLKLENLFDFAPTLDEAYIHLSQALKANQDTGATSVLA